MSLKYQWDIIGHDKALMALEGDMGHGNVAHAYLFAGPDHVGKYSVAKRFAHLLQCENGFCGECHVCQEIEKGYHADTVEMADNGESVKIEQIRGVLDRLNMTRQGAYKVFLLDNIERMTLESANALLKTLEDPPDGVIFLLTTSRLKEIIPTILSRVRLLKMSRLTDNAMTQLLEKHFPLAEKEITDTVSSLALGRPGKALALLNDPQLYDQYRKMYGDIEMFLRQPDRVNQFLYIEELSASAKEEKSQRLIQEFLDIFQFVLRKELLLASRGERGIFPPEKLLRLLEQVRKTQELLKRNVNARLLLENMMLSL